MPPPPAAWRPRIVPLPAVWVVAGAGLGVSAPWREPVLRWGARTWVRAHTRLPVADPASPVEAHVWVEVAADSARGDGAAHDDGAGRSRPGWLGCDLPGFPGTLGTAVTLAPRSAGAPEIVACADARAQWHAGDPDIDYLALYHRIHGRNAHAGGAAVNAPVDF